MGRLILFNMITVDGFFETKNRELNWHVVDEEFNKFSIEQLESADALIFGRITYELMFKYWTTEDALTNDAIVAGKMNSLPKIIFSKTLKKVEWANTKLFSDNVEQIIKEIKKNSTKNIFLLGSANLTTTLKELNLIDEYRILINPVILGEGRPLFEKTPHLKWLKLMGTRTFKSGNILLQYENK
jgi:dihydrofolate reductase